MKTKKHGFKIHTPNFLKEVTDNALGATNMGVLKVPMNVFRKYLVKVAERAVELNDPVMNKLMVDMTLYEVADPESKDFDRSVIEKVYSDYEDYINSLK
jgi:hypothetical protein